jgi:hypothetical protein
MRTLLSIAILLSLAAPVLAEPASVPEPSGYALLGIGALGLLLSRRNKR